MIVNYLVLLLLAFNQVLCRPIPRDPDVAYALYCLDLLDDQTYAFRSLVFEEERHNSFDNIIANVEAKLEALGIAKKELQDKKVKLEKSLQSLNSNIKDLQSALWWVSVYISNWRKKLKSRRASTFVSWSNFNHYLSQVDSLYLHFKSVLIPEVSDLHREVIMALENKRLQLLEGEQEGKIVLGNTEEMLINMDDAVDLYESEEAQKMLQNSLVLLKLREFRLSTVKEPWDVAVVSSQSGLFSVFSPEIIKDFVSQEVLYTTI